MVFSMVLPYVLVRCDQLFRYHHSPSSGVFDIGLVLKVWKCYQKLMVIDVNVGINLSRFSFFLMVNIAFGGS